MERSMSMTHDEVRELKEAIQRAAREVNFLRHKLEEEGKGRLAKRAETILSKLIGLDWDIIQEEA